VWRRSDGTRGPARARRRRAHSLTMRLAARPASAQLPAGVRTQMVRLLTTMYEGFNDVHLTEKPQALAHEACRRGSEVLFMHRPNRLNGCRKDYMTSYKSVLSSSVRGTW